MTDRPRRIVLVSYLNTLPMLEGIREHLGDRVDLNLAHPADCAGILFQGEADYGLVPVGALLDRQDWRPVTGYGIGCDGLVDTVCLFGDTPITSWSEVLLDYQSRTSVLLTQYLLNAYWGLDLPVKAAAPGYESRIGGSVGGLIIGDRAFNGRTRFAYGYDLGQAWKEHTGLPFVFALWVARCPVDPAFETSLVAAIETGLRSAPLIARNRQLDYPGYDLQGYFQDRIKYRMDEAMILGFDTFRRELAAHPRTSGLITQG